MVSMAQIHRYIWEKNDILSHSGACLPKGKKKKIDEEKKKK